MFYALSEGWGPSSRSKSSAAYLQGGKIKQFSSRAHSRDPCPKCRRSPLRHDWGQPARSLYPWQAGWGQGRRRRPTSGRSAAPRPRAMAGCCERNRRKGDLTPPRAQFPLVAPAPLLPPGPAVRRCISCRRREKPATLPEASQGTQRGTALVSDVWAKEGAQEKANWQGRTAPSRRESRSRGCGPERQTNRREQERLGKRKGIGRGAGP